MEYGYKKLEIYKLAHLLGVRIHTMTMTLPKFEMYEEGSQIRRSSKSISNNIVEGFALRKYKNEYLHYLYRAYGSCEETTEHFQYLVDTKSLTVEKYFGLAEQYKQLSAMMFRFIQSIEKNFETPNFLKEPEEIYANEMENQKPEP
jgi:four helix bundle protein